MNRRLVACALLALCAACATLPEPPAAGGDWPARRSALQALDSWSLTGRVAVAAGREGFSGGIEWRQDGERARIELRGPVGGHALAIEVAGAAFTVQDGKGARIEGEEARRYVAGRIGAELPVAELRYWLVGAPSPGSPSQETVATDGGLATLEQAGWQVRYLRYTTAGARPLPARIDMQTGTLRLKLSVSDWRLAP